MDTDGRQGACAVAVFVSIGTTIHESLVFLRGFLAAKERKELKEEGFPLCSAIAGIRAMWARLFHAASAVSFCMSAWRAVKSAVMMRRPFSVTR